MRRMHFLAAALCLFTLNMSVAGTDSSSDDHGMVVQTIIRNVRASQFVLKDGDRIDHKQVHDLILAMRDSLKHGLADYKIALQQAEQGEEPDVAPGSEELLNLRVRFREIFPDASDNLLFPLDEAVVVYAPESSFAGLSVYGRHGELKGRIVEKQKKWNTILSSGFISIDGTRYWTILLTDDKRLDGTDHRTDANNVKWGDIKNRIAFELSERKSGEDRKLEEDALARFPR